MLDVPAPTLPLFISDASLDDAIDGTILRHADIGHQISELDKLDIRAGYRFLEQYTGSSDTFASYRRELEKLYQWRLAIHPNIPIRRLKTDYLQEFFRFCSSPPAHWVAPRVFPRLKGKKPNPNWRPFIATKNGGSPSQKSLKVLFAVCSSFYEYLVEENAAEYNPVKNIRQKSKFFTQNTYDPVRRLSVDQINYLLMVAHEYAEKDQDAGERASWIVSLLLDGYLRISELVKYGDHQPTMGIFFRRESSWWMSIIGKGRKMRVIPLSSKLEHSLVRYRRSQGLSDYPTRNESTPLIHRLRSGGSSQGALKAVRQVRDIVGDLFSMAYDRMLAEGRQQDAAELKEATVHWLRHTGISEEIKVRNAHHVKEDAGHSSFATTERYIDIEMTERAESKG